MSSDLRRPLRITLLTTYYHPVIGGVESHMRQIAPELQARGFDVRVVTKRLDRSTPQRGTIDGIRIERVRPVGGRTRLAKWSMLPFAFAHLLRQRPEPDVIFCPDYRGIGLAALAAGRLLERPVVLQAATPGALSCTSWDGELAALRIRPDGPFARALKRTVQRAYGSAAMYNCISGEIEAEALACGIRPSRLARIPHGVDIRHFRPASADERRREREARGWPEDRIICLYLGRLSEEKGILDLLRAWLSVEDRSTRLVVVGPDMTGHPLDAGLAARTFVAEHGLSERVLFAGPISDPAPLLRAADIFVQPSHYEAFGISAIEAMASALPVVATRTGGLVDFLVHEDTALLCGTGETAELAGAVNRLIGDATLRQRLASRAREVATQKFDKDVIADAYARLFRTVTGAWREPDDGRAAGGRARVSGLFLP